ncbi:MAG TPA: hypothetical protein VFG23_24860 [Polyangia bacterium]|nr:hypothetical protein [Polyangia bacterium]
MRGLAVVAGGLWVLSMACATSGEAGARPPVAVADRMSPASLQQGPSLQETGRIATMPVSNGGLQIQAASIGQARPRRSRKQALRGMREPAHPAP